MAYGGGTEIVPLEKSRLSKKITFGSSVKNMGGFGYVLTQNAEHWQTPAPVTDEKTPVCTRVREGEGVTVNLVVFLTKQEINRKLTTLSIFSFITAFSFRRSYQMFFNFPQQERQTENNIKDKKKKIFSKALCWEWPHWSRSWNLQEIATEKSKKISTSTFVVENSRAKLFDIKTLLVYDRNKKQTKEQWKVRK